MTDEEIRDLVKECGLDWQRGHMPLFDGDKTNRYEVLINAAVARAPTPVMRILAGAAFLPQNRDRPLGELRAAAEIIFGTEAIEAAMLSMRPNVEANRPETAAQE